MSPYSPANAKIKALVNVPALQPFLTSKRKIYSFDLISGWSCPFAKICLSKVHKVNNRAKVIDGPETTIRCFSASQEALLPAAYNKRMVNFLKMRQLAKISPFAVADYLDTELPNNAGIIRIHVGGDMFNENYFLGWLWAAVRNPTVLFYAYTKSLNLWVKHQDKIPENFVLTASRGGRLDSMIDSHNLREAKIVFSEKKASQLGLEIDHDDSHAADISKKHQSFALLIHGTQPKNTEAAKALVALKGKGSYSR